MTEVKQILSLTRDAISRGFSTKVYSSYVESLGRFEDEKNHNLSVSYHEQIFIVGPSTREKWEGVCGGSLETLPSL